MVKRPTRPTFRNRHYAQYVIDSPSGIQNKTLTHQNPKLALQLHNMLPQESGGITVRKGQEWVITPQLDIQHVTSYNYRKLLIFMSNFVLYKFNTITKEYTNLGITLQSIPTATFETNNRIIYFFDDGSTPKEFYIDDNNFATINELNFYGAPTTVDPDKSYDVEFTNYDFCVRYRTRLYYYKKGNNQLYYTSPNAYKGELYPYDITGIFNVTGTLVSLEIMNHQDGVGQQSFLVAVLDTGDILIFNGSFPEDTNEWSVVSSEHLFTPLYFTMRIGVNLYAIGKNGIYNINSLMASGEEVRTEDIAKVFNLDLYDDLPNMQCFVYNDMGIIYSRVTDKGFIYNKKERGFTTFDGIQFKYPCILENNIYFLNTYKGYYIEDDDGNNHYSGVGRLFNAENDFGNPITAKYETGFFNFNMPFKKIIYFVNREVSNLEGDYQIFQTVYSDFRDSGSSTDTPLPILSTEPAKWSDFRDSWDSVHRVLWSKSYRLYPSYNILRQSTRAYGTYISILTTVVVNSVKSINFGKIKIDYEGSY